MPLFISDEELRLLAGDTAAVAERADAAIRELRRQVDTARAEADAAAIAAEQTCALLEQRYATLSAEFDRSQAEAAELTAASERRAAELAASQAEIHQLHIQAVLTLGFQLDDRFVWFGLVHCTDHSMFGGIVDC